MRIECLPQEQRANPQYAFVALLQDVCVKLNGFELNITSYGIPPNTIEAVIGPNGAGKTTLCDVISGKTRITAGRVLLAGKEIKGESETAIAERGVGRKFQTPSVFDSLTVFENLELMLPGQTSLLANLRATIRPAQKETIEATLIRFGLLKAARTLARHLSHGQRQWLELAMLVVKSPRLLLIDEPAAGLTGTETEATVEILKDLSKDHAIVVIEHNMDFIRQLGAKVTVMHGGTDIAYGSYSEVWENERVRQVYQLRDGASPLEIEAPNRTTAPNFMVDNIHFSYGSVEVLRGVNMEVKLGAVTALLGRNGAGKTTLLKTLAGVLTPTSGSVLMESVRIDRKRPHERARSGIALVPQGRGIFANLSVEENLLLGFENERSDFFNVSDRLHMTFPWLRRYTKKRAGELSGGQQQQLAIARALVGKPRVLLMDEPTDGIDAVTEQEIMLLIRELAAGTSSLTDEPVTLLVVEQNIGFITAIASHFHILERGSIVHSGAMESLTVEMIGKYLGD